MLKLLTRVFYSKDIFTSERNLFCEIYKWECGLHILLLFVNTFMPIAFYLASSWICISLFGWESVRILLFATALVLMIVQIIRRKKAIKYNLFGVRTPGQIRMLHLEEWIRKFVSINGKALGAKEWRMIKNNDIDLYEDLLCDDCNHCCYYYSLEIARHIEDCTLVWGAVEEPFEAGENYYAHAFILRNGYVYDSNMRQSVNYEKFKKLYKLKTYKEWSYEEYSKQDFREVERNPFRKWCRDNNVLVYDKF